MKRFSFWEWCWMVLGFGLAFCAFVAMAHAQGTNAPGYVLHVPAFDIALPAKWAAWIAAHGVLLWIGIRGAIKALTRYQQGRPAVAWVVWFLEHASFNKNVATVAQRIVGADIPPANVVVTPAEAKAAIEAPTPNGLSGGTPIDTGGH